MNFFNAYLLGFSRYKNMFCAQCHGIEDVRFWTVEVGCIEVANDECQFPLHFPPKAYDADFDEQVRLYRNNPPPQLIG